MELDTVHILCKGQGLLKSNEHIIRVWDTMLEEDSDHHLPNFCILMELCEGTLANYLKDLQGMRSFIPQRNIFAIVIQILEALRFCHSKGFVHRDLKPSNGTSMFPVELTSSALC